MTVIRLIPVIFSFMLLAAHFSRAGLFPLMILCLAIPLLLFIKKKWVVRSIQVLLVLGAAEWIRSMLGYIEIRKSIDEDWTRLAIILTVVALGTALSGLVFRTKNVHGKYFN